MSVAQEIFGVAGSVLALAMFSVCALEVRNYLRGWTVIGGTQLAVRLIGGAVLLTLLVKVIYGVYWVEYRQVAAEHFVRYWAHCLLLAYVAFVLAGLDLYLLFRFGRRRGAAGRIAGRLEALARRFQAPAPTGPGGDPKAAAGARPPAGARRTER